MKFIDLTGKRFGRLVVIKRVEDHVQPSGQHKTRWLCQCDCGNEVCVISDNLNNKSTQSCGCLQDENRHRRKFNTYDLSGEYGIGYTSKGEEFYFDLDDYNKIKNYTWYINKDGYVFAYSDNKNKVSMHRIVMNCNDDKEVDHIYGKPFRHDNRKAKLRIVEHFENMINKGLRSDNKYGATGVWYREDLNKWRASLQYNKKIIDLGSYETFDDAIKARKEAEEKYFGEYSYDNSMKMGV